DKEIRFPSIVYQIPAPKLRRYLSLKATFISVGEKVPRMRSGSRMKTSDSKDDEIRFKVLRVRR
ncbi:MAG: hypothetical protein ACK56I_12660, partial [bacterium]